MRMYKVPLTFQVFIREKELPNLHTEARESLKTLIELDGINGAIELAEVGEPQELSSKEERDFITAATDAYKTQIMAIANGLAKDPHISAEQAQEILRKMF
jgi:hypothetical protein